MAAAPDMAIGATLTLEVIVALVNEWQNHCDALPDDVETDEAAEALERARLHRARLKDVHAQLVDSAETELQEALNKVTLAEKTLATKKKRLQRLQGPGKSKFAAPLERLSAALDSTYDRHYHDTRLEAVRIVKERMRTTNVDRQALVDKLDEMDKIRRVLANRKRVLGDHTDSAPSPSPSPLASASPRKRHRSAADSAHASDVQPHAQKRPRIVPTVAEPPAVHFPAQKRPPTQGRSPVRSQSKGKGKSPIYGAPHGSLSAPPPMLPYSPAEASVSHQEDWDGESDSPSSSSSSG